MAGFFRGPGMKNRPDQDGLGLSLRSRIAPFIAMDVMREANALRRRGADIVHMEIGQPHTPAPRRVRDAAMRAIGTDPLGYTEALGLPALRERIAQHYRETYGLSLDAERVVVTTGSSAGFIVAFLALFDQGNGLLIPEPGYPCYRQIASVLGLRPVGVRMGAAEGWRPALPPLRASLARGDINGLLIASPSNPSGTMLSAHMLGEIAEACAAAGKVLISDEIYHGLTYTAPAASALSCAPDAIVIGSFSKYFSMTGWRVGWLIAPKAHVRTIERLQQNLFVSPPAISQHAAMSAFDATEELEAYKSVYAANRALLLDGLPDAGFDALAPADGAFYIYADVSKHAADSAELAANMLAEAGVAVTPGLDFDPVEGSRFIRFAYAGATARIEEALRRLKAWRPH